MSNRKIYIEHEEKVLEATGSFKHVMALFLNPASNYHDGIIRCITSREGDVGIKGFTDRSKLYKVEAKSFEDISISKQLVIGNEQVIIDQIGGKDWDFIGLEDPDIWHDDKSGLLHVYFTIPFKSKKIDRTITYLGHAVGKNLDSLKMIMPVLMAKKTDPDGGAKELSIVPVSKNGLRYNLIESSKLVGNVQYSVVKTAICEDMGKTWEYGKIIFHPKEHDLLWIAGHASPGPLFPDTFIDIGKGKRVGIINGREKDQKVGNKIKYGVFSAGLFIYDYERGEIDWVSPEPIIKDTEARTITFTSQFIQTEKDTGILYAHVDDSFVRTYTVYADGIKTLLH